MVHVHRQESHLKFVHLSREPYLLLTVHVQKAVIYSSFYIPRIGSSVCR